MAKVTKDGCVVKYYYNRPNTFPACYAVLNWLKREDPIKFESLLKQFKEDIKDGCPCEQEEPASDGRG